MRGGGCGGPSAGVALAQQVFLLAGQHKLVALVVDGDRDRRDPGRALRRQRGDPKARVERVTGVDRLQEFGRLLDKGERRPVYSMGYLEKSCLCPVCHPAVTAA